MLLHREGPSLQRDPPPADAFHPTGCPRRQRGRERPVRGGLVAHEVGRRDLQARAHLVEAPGDGVLRQQVPERDRDAEQILHRLLVLGPVQAPQRRPTLALVDRQRRGVEARPKPFGEFPSLGLLGRGTVPRRHLPRRQPVMDARPGPRRIRFAESRVQGFKRRARLGGRVVVALEAKALEGGTDRCRHLGGQGQDESQQDRRRGGSLPDHPVFHCGWLFTGPARSRGFGDPAGARHRPSGEVDGLRRRCTCGRMTRRTRQIHAMEIRPSMENRHRTKRQRRSATGAARPRSRSSASLEHPFQIGAHHVDAPIYTTSVVVQGVRRFDTPPPPPCRLTSGTYICSWSRAVHPPRVTDRIHPSCAPICRVLETRTGSTPATARENPRCSRQPRVMAGLSRTRQPAGYIEERDQFLKGAPTKPQQVQVPGGPMRRTLPHREQHGTFEQEAFAMGRGGQPADDPLHTVAREDPVEFPPLRLRQREQAWAHRGGDIRGLHASDST